MRIDTNSITGSSLMRLKEVIRRTGLSRSEIYRQIESNEFPKSIKIGERMVAWHSLEIDHWIAKRIARRDATKQGLARRPQSDRHESGGGK